MATSFTGYNPQMVPCLTGLGLFKFSLLLSAISATALAAPVAVVGNVGLSHPDPDTIAVRDESVAVSSSLLERAASFLTASLHKTKKIAVEVRQADGPERETIPPSESCLRQSTRETLMRKQALSIQMTNKLSAYSVRRE